MRPSLASRTDGERVEMSRLTDGASLHLCAVGGEYRGGWREHVKAASSDARNGTAMPFWRRLLWRVLHRSKTSSSAEAAGLIDLEKLLDHGDFAGAVRVGRRTALAHNPNLAQEIEESLQGTEVGPPDAITSTRCASRCTHFGDQNKHSNNSSVPSW
jgi:hypothetical protein